MDRTPDRDLVDETDREHHLRPREGPYDRPERDADDPIGDDAYPGGSGTLPPTGDMDDPVPETGMPGGPPPPNADDDPRT
ncbi:MAG: hypothetical protein ACRDGD_00035 [Candidatus Limnocylindria bacterium]